MAIVLRFDPDRRPHAPRGGANKGPATILFFTGVRYERGGAGEMAARKPVRRTVKRKAHGRHQADRVSDTSL